MKYKDLLEKIQYFGPKAFRARHINQMDRTMRIFFLYDNIPDRRDGREILTKIGVPDRAISMVTQGADYVYRYKIKVTKY